MRKFYLLLVAVLLSSIGSFAATWYSTPSGGEVTTLTNWWSSSAGTGSNPTTFATAGDIWIIQSAMTSNGTTWTVQGDVTMNSGSLNNNSTSSGYSYYYIYGTLTMNNSTTISATSGGSYVYVYLYGNLIMNGTSSFNNPPTYTYVYMANTASTLASPQQINISSTGSGAWSYFQINANTVSRLTGNCNMNVFASNTINENGTLDCSTYSMTGSSSITVSSTGSLYTANTAGISASLALSGTKTLDPGATYGFNGSSAQVTSTSLPSSLNATGKLIINNTAGVTLSQNTTIANTSGGLTFTNGVLNTSSYTLTVPGAAAAVSGAGAGKYVKGFLYKTISGLTSVNYEVGDAGYSPMSLSLNVAGTAGSIAVKATNGMHPQQASSTLSSLAICSRYWTIANSGAAGPATVVPTATYNLSDIVGGSNASFVTNQYAGGAWLPTPLASTNATAPYTTAPTAGIALSSLSGDFLFGAVGPSVYTSAPSLSFGVITTGTSSPSQVFNLNGVQFSGSGSITVAASANFQVSSNNVTWVSSYTLPFSGGTIPATPVYVRFNPTLATAYTGTVTVTGGGLPGTANLVVMDGTGAPLCSATPTPGTASITPSGGGASTSFTLSLTGATVGGGITYQWQSSTSPSSGFTNIPGASTANYSFTGIGSTQYYQAVVTCPSYAAATSNTVVATYSVNVTYTGAVGTYTVPAGMTALAITVKGAQGGNGSGVGGQGAVMSGNFCVTPGQVLRYIVGGQGQSGTYTGGGGGGSFVWDNATNTPLIIAGGGGGGSYQGAATIGVNAVTTINGTNGGGGTTDGGGVNGFGGTTPTGADYGAGGAGWYSNGANGLGGCSTAQGGATPLTGGAGGVFGGSAGSNGSGGFGGGGGSQGQCSWSGGGGGGGYSGGGGGIYTSGAEPGGGGGSYNTGVSQVNSVGNTGDGLIVFSTPTSAGGLATPATVTFGPQVVSTSSAPQTTTFIGVGLTAGGTLTLTAPAGFDVSVDGGTTWTPGTTPATYTVASCVTLPVKVRFSPVATSSYSGNLTISGAGLPSTINVPLSGLGILACSGVPTPGTVTMSPTAGGTTTTFNMSVSGYTVAGGITFQWQSSTDSATWADIAGATNTSYSASGISATTYFRCNVTCTNSFISVATNFVTANFLATSCTPTYLYTTPYTSYTGCYYTEGIMGSPSYPIILTGAGGTGFTDPTSCTNTGYIDETTTSYTATMNVGVSYTLRVGSNTTGYTMSDQVWIDFNNDGIFSAAESVSGPTGNYFTGITSTQVISIPGTATPGIYKMRIVGCQSSTSPTTYYPQYPNIPSCPTSAIYYGDARDYTITIAPPVACAPPTNQPTGLTLTQPALTSINGSFTNASPLPDGYLVVMTTSSVAPTAPVNGTTYTAGTSALGGTILSVGTGTTFSATGLTPGSQYWFWVYDYTQFCYPGATPDYNTTAPLSGTLAVPACSVNGTKVVGPTGDYPTIAAALNAIGLAGIAGHVNIDLQTTYTGETYPITINSYPCISASNGITIRPQGTMTVTANYGGPMFSFNGARYITIDGRVGATGTVNALTFANTNTNGAVAQFINDASYNTIKYATLLGSNLNSTSGVVVFGTTTGTTGSDYDSLDHCNIMDATGGTPQQCVYGTGTTGKENDHIVISNCNIANFYTPLGSNNASGINITSGNTLWTITNNRMYETNTCSYSGSFTHVAINCQPGTSGSGFVITNNIIGYNSADGTGNMTFTSTTNPTIRPIYLSVGYAAATTVQNNTITNISATASSSYMTFHGIYVSVGSVNILSNTIGSATTNGAITLSFATGTTGAAYGIYSGTSTPSVVTAQNNIISGINMTYGTASSESFYGIYYASYATANISNNTIGSTTLANSINLSTTSTGSVSLYGIYGSISSSTPVAPIISNNTISNLNNAGTGSGSLTAGIFFNSTASPTISGNLIQNITNAGTQTGVTSQSGLAGIAYTSSGTPTILQNTINALANVNTTSTANTAVAGIYYTSATNGIINRNRIYDLRNASTYTTAVTTPPTATGILLYIPTTAVTVQNNMISLGNGQTSNTSFSGIIASSNSSYTLRAYYNSVNIEGTATSGTMNTAAFNRGNYSTTVNNSTTVDLRDNIFTNSRSGGGNHYAIGNGIGVTTSSATGWAASASNFNMLGAAAGTVGYWSGAKTFANWKLAGSGNNDPNSYSGVPSAVVTYSNTATGDLHINMGTTANYIESHGTAIAGLAYDYDNDVRPGPVGSVNGGGTLPDIGADEFDGVPQDNIPPVITYTTPIPGCGTGDRVFTATLTDYSGVQTTSPLQPQVYFRKNGGAWAHTAGTLTSGVATNGVWTFTVSASAMLPTAGLALTDVVQYYVTAQDTNGYIGANPSTGFAATDVNTVTTPPTAPNSYTVTPSLGGTYTVAATGGDYPTITAAVNAYNAACLSGPVTFILADPSYSVSETFPITINANSTASATNTLTIKPATTVNVTVTGSTTTTAIFKLLNANYVTIDGLNTGSASLTLNNPNTGTNTDIWLASTSGTGPGNNNITLKNMTMYCGTNTGTTSSWNIIAGVDGGSPANTAGFNNDNIIIQGNTFLRSAYGIWSWGTVNSSTGGLDNWNVSNNTFGPASYSTTDNIAYNGCYMQNHFNATISGNTFRNIGTTAQTSQVVGIGFASNGTGITISQNTFNGIYTNSGQGVGIYLSTNVINSTITRNTITNIITSSSGSSTSATCGIYVGTLCSGINITRNNINTITSNYSAGCCSGAGRGIMLNAAAVSDILVANNIISNIYGMGYSGSSYSPAGIDIEGSTGGVKIYANTVNLNTSYAGYNITSFTSACLNVNTSTAANLDVRDNIFTNTYDNTTVVGEKNYAIYSNSPAAAFSNINYNSYFVASGNPMGYVGSTNRTALADMQAGFGGNANSLVLQPAFVGATDPHLTPLAVNGPLVAGVSLAPTVTVDYDGTSRSATTPVIGAHEVAIPTCSSITAGTVTATPSPLCVSGVPTVTATGVTTGLNSSYQWKSSTDGVTFTAIAGATNPTYAAPSAITSTTYYRMIATCSTISSKDSATVTATVYANPSAIGGTPAACVGGTSSLTNSTTGGGTWSSGNTAIATLGSSSGVLTGVATGTTNVTFTATATGCTATAIATVVAVPVPTVTATTSTICNNLSTAITSAAPPTPLMPFESWENGVPTVPGTPVDGWSTNATTSTWFSQQSSSSSPSVIGGHTGANYCRWNSYGISSGSASLISPVINMAGVTNGQVSVWVYRDGGSYQASSGYGSEGFTLYFNTSPSVTGATSLGFIPRASDGTTSGGITGVSTPGTGTSGWYQYTANIPATFNTATNYLMLYAYSQYGDNCYIDDISVTGSVGASTWNPVTNLYTDAAFTTPVTPTTQASTVYFHPTSVTSVATAFTYTATASNGVCTGSASTTVTVNPSPLPITGTLNSCAGGSTVTLADATSGGVWSSTATSIATIDASGVVTPSTTVGSTTISYTLAGCAATATFNVNAAPGPITGTGTVCTGLTTTLANSGGTGTWTSSATSKATVTNAGVVTGVAAGTATISYVNSCGIYATTVVTVLQTPAAITGTAAVCQGLTTTLADANTGGTWTTLSSNISIGASNGVVTGVTAGTAAVTYDLGNGCAVASTVTTVNVTPTVNVSPAASTTICLSKSSTFTASITPSVTGTTFAWSGISGATGLGCTSCTVNTITPTATGSNTYSVVATTPAGCIASNIVTVNVNPLPPSITGSTLMCAGGSVGLSNTLGGGTWASSNTGVAIVVSTTGSVTGMAAGTSRITYNAPTGCFSTTVVTVQATPSAAPTNSSPICVGGIATLTANPANGATTYAWSGPNLSATTVANPTAVPTTTAVYSLTVTNGTATPGCSPTTVYTTSVTVNSIPTAAPTNSGPICVGGQVTLSANPIGSTSTYAWSGPNLSSSAVANPTATPTTTSTYTVTVTDGSGGSNCASTYTTSVTVNGLPTVSSITPSVTSLCPNGAVTFTAGTTAGTGSVVSYAWSGPNGYSATTAANNVVFTPTTVASSGAYSVRVTYSANGCVSDPVATSPAVTVNALPTVASVTPSSTTPCTGSALTLTSGATTGSGSIVSYNWSGPNSYSATTGTPSAVLSPTTTAADGVYSLTVTYTGPGCTSSAATTPAITFADGPVLASASSNSPVCVGGTLTLTANSPSNVTSYSWSGPVAITSGGTTGSATVTPAILAGSGIYSVTVTNSATSCVNVYTTSVTVNQVPSVSSVSSNSPVCANNTLTLSATGASNVTGYAWTGPVAITNSATATGSVPSITTAGTGTYTLTVNNGIGSNCAATYTTAVTVPASSPVYSVTGGGVYCSGGSGVQVGLSNSTSGVQYQLYRGATAVGGTVTGTGTALTFGFQTAAGTYTVTGTNTTTGCVAQMASSAVVSISPPPSAFTVTGGGSYCAGGTGVAVNLSYSDLGASYQLYNGATPMGAAVVGTGAPITFGNQTLAGSYNVVANPGSSCGLVMAGSVTVSVNPLPTSYTLTGGGTYCAGGAGVPIGLTFGSSGIQYTLYNGATATTVVNGANTALTFGNQAAAGTYSVSAVNLTTGCVGPMAGSVNVTINPAPTAYSVTGGGTYCSGGTGIAVGLSSSAAGVTYQLYNGSSAVGTGVAGTGSPLAFGNQSAAGVYTVLATGSNACTTAMSGSATVSVNSAPIAFAVTGGGNYCSGGAGMAIGLAGSAAGVNYQLYNGSTVVTTISGTGSAISFGTYTAAGTYSVLGTNPTTGCATNMSGTAIININTSPAAFAVTGSGGYCPGGSGVAVGLAGSVSGVSYQLYLGSTAVGTPMIGSGFGLSFGNQTAAGTYTVLATIPSTGCTSAMTGSAIVNINPLPTAFTVTGGGNYCSGGTGVAIGLTGSTAGISYQLYLGAAPQGAAVSGTSSALNFGLKTAAGTYSVIATNTSTNCTSIMTGSAVVSVNPLPSVYNVTGGGGYCTGGAGVAVGLNGSVSGTTYQLYNGATAVGGPASGTGSAISFGNQTTAGTYSVVATSGLGCTANMTGTASVTINTLPTAYAMTGGGTICSGSTGTPIGLSNSTVGVSYQLYNGAATVGSPVVSGAAGAITFGNQTAAGTYTVLATTPTGCTAPMTGTAVINVNASPAAFAVTGGGAYCSGGSGATIGMSNSAVGVNYQLYLGAAAQGSAVAGTGAAFNFPTSATTAGTYTVNATAGTCSTAQTGNAVVSITALPTVYAVTGGGTVCAGTGSAIGLTSSQTGVNYQLYNGSTASGAPVAGSTGVAISFGTRSVAGTYTVSATNTAGCTTGMGGATVINVNPAPTVFNVTGGGSYCSGTGGLTVGLSGTNSGVTYTLYNGSSIVTTMSGTGTAISFPAQTAAGTYSVQASDGTTSCTSNMSGTATISIISLPTAYSVTGGGGYCSGGTGANVGLSGSNIGINYQLYAGGVPSGSIVGGTGLPLSFGSQTVAGTYSVVAINPSTGCINTMTGAVTVTVNALPTAFTVTGGGGYCSGSTGVAIGLAGSQSGVTYKLYNGTAIAGGPVAGTGAAVNFGLQTTVGTYSVLATTTATGCTNAMSGMPTVSVNPLPTAFVVTGGGNICAGGAGVNVGLNSSTAGVGYQLYVSGFPAGAPVMGTGGAISFGPQTTGGAYNVVATDVTTNCTNYMSGAVNVNVNPAPTAYSVTGGGTMCAGGAGSNVYLASSDPGVYYQLYNGATSVGMSMVGSGSSINFGLQTAAGNYTVMATDPSTGCSGAMSGIASIIVNPAPTAFAVTGGGNYCSGTAGVNVGLANSTSGIDYQLYNGTTAIGSPVAGTGSAISFGTQTMTGTYTVLANNSATGCSGSMTGSATITVTASPAAFAVTGGGHYCAGGTGVPVGLAASSSGVTYQLYNGAGPVGGAIAGTGGVINFGNQTGAGIYTVLATSTSSACASAMAGSATVVIDSIPATQTVTGGGTFCSGGTGVVIGLGGSESGVSYQLYNGALTAGSPVLGTGAAITFGAQTAAGTYNVMATNTAGCTRSIPGVATIIVTPAPTAYAVTGGGGYCTGGTGVSVGTSGSDVGVNYQLYRGSTAVSGLVAGTGSALNFGLQTTAGVYTVQASSTATGCTGGMTGSATVTVNATPTAYNVLSTGSSYCAGGTGVNILLSSSDAGVSYQLFNGSTPTGAPVAGSGSLLDFGPQTAAGTYVVVATGSGSCSSNMTGSASISIIPQPALYTITGGGGYCSGTSGAPIGLSSSDSGVTYQLFRGTTTVGTPMTGTGSSISFGPQSTVGSYVVVATNTASGCQRTMSGSVSVSINPLPGLQSVTGGGTICSGSAGVPVGLTGSASGISYQLYNGSTLVGSAIPGTGSAISFGPQTAAGVYTVLAVSSSTLCGRSMTGNATVVVNPAPTAYAVTGGGNYCIGSSTGVAVGLASSATGFTYQMYNGTTPVGGALAGTGSALDFGVQSTPGTYIIKATDATTMCTNTMTGTAVITSNAAPAMHSVTGGGSYCGGGTGVHVGLDGSNNGISYRLYNGATAIGSAMAGTGSALDFGAITGTGSYTILATNTTSGCTAAMNGSADVVAVTAVTPSVSISTGVGDTMCLGILTTFNAIGVNGGTGATYQWQVNGSNVGLGGSTYTYLPANGDVVAVQMNSSLSCATPTSATATLPVTVLVSQLPVAQLNVTPNDTVCMGTAVSFSVTPVYGGSAPTYTWKNGAGAILATNTTSYSYTPAYGDVVYVQMSSNYRCRLADNVESIHSLMVIDSPTAPVVVIPTPVGFREGQAYTLIASVSNGGRNPEFQWYVNSAPVAGATSMAFTSSSLVSGDSVSCLVTKISSCAPMTGSGSVLMKTTVGVSGVTFTNSDIRLLPNPNTGDFVIRGTVGSADDQDFVAEITDMLGQVIYKDNLSARNGNINQHISLSNTLANGMYMLTLRSATESKVFHFVIGK